MNHWRDMIGRLRILKSMHPSDLRFASWDGQRLPVAATWTSQLIPWRKCFSFHLCVGLNLICFRWCRCPKVWAMAGSLWTWPKSSICAEQVRILRVLVQVKPLMSPMSVSFRSSTFWPIWRPCCPVKDVWLRPEGFCRDPKKTISDMAHPFYLFTLSSAGCQLSTTYSSSSSNPAGFSVARNVLSPRAPSAPVLAALPVWRHQQHL